MRHSFRFKITFFLMVTIALTILLCWLLNHSFLEDYYVHSKKSVIKKVYQTVNEYVPFIDENLLSEEQKEVIDRYEIANNVKLYLFQDVELESNLGTMYFTYFIYPQQVLIPHTKVFRTPISGPGGEKNENREYYRIYESVQEYTFPNLYAGIIEQVETIEDNDMYQVMTQHNTSMESDFMDLYGALDCGYTVFIRSGLESVQEAVSISNQFLSILGSVVIIVSAIIAYFFSRRFTRPVLELSEIAKKMSNLEFDVRYPVKSKDEIGVLGTSINSLSEKLEETISELKSANIELQTDIEKKMQVDEMRKEFLSNVTHELKTPIALIQGYAEGLKDNINEDAENRNFYCEVIMDEAIKMNKMVKKLLSLNQIEFGNTQMEIERFDVTALITSVINSSEILFRGNQVNLYFPVTHPVYVWADEYMIEEVLTNYISNALNHIDGERRIEIRLTESADKVRLSVFNTGAPIPEEDIDRIWIKFYKVDKARTREYGGNGIGLSIVKAIMDSHNQEYGVINHTDGVEFWIELDSSKH